MIDKKKIKEKIEQYELHHQGLAHVNMAWVEAVNLRIAKREDKVYADIILHYPEDKKKERYDRWDYKLSEMIKR